MYDYDDTFEFDTNGDQLPNYYTETYDTDGDGVIDTVQAMLDTTGDGIIDTASVGVDTNGDGVLDTFVTESTANGVYEVTRGTDVNADGLMDTTKVYTDYDGDGQFERMSKIYDSDNDGLQDTMEVAYDYTGTGTSDQQMVYSYNPYTGEIAPMADGLDIDFLFNPETLTVWPNYDPAQSDPDAVAGEPAERIEVWECQGETNRCALYSQKFVIEEITGQEIDIEEFAQVAAEHGWFTEEGGTTFLNINNMLDYYGVDNDMRFNNTIADLESALDDGAHVIVSVDCEQIWYGKEPNIFSPESGANHAVEVIGIDRTDPNNPMVILNDSGTPNGQGEMVPLEVFEAAWNDGDSQMVTCYA